MTDAKPIRWGILSTARIASKLARALQDAPHAELVCVASRSESRARDWAARHDVAETCRDYTALLQREDLDAIYLPLPPALHEEWTIRAAEAGKHVLCEKPLATSHAAAVRMADACAAAGVKFMEGVMWYYHPRALAMRQALEAGSLGTLRRVTSAFSIHRQFPPTDFRQQRALGGGSLFDLGWYCIGAALWSVDRLPCRVQGFARWLGEVDESFSGVLEFDDCLWSSFDCGFENSARRWFEISGESGSLVCEDFTRPWSADRPRFWQHGENGKATESIVTSTLSQEACLVEHFSRAVLEDHDLGRAVQRALNTQRVCNALLDSARTQQVVEIT